MDRKLRTLAGGVALAALVVGGLAGCGSDGGSGSVAVSSSDDLCQYAKDLEASTSDEALGNLDEATFDRLDDIVQNVQERAPEEIKEDVETVARGFADVREIFAEYDYDLAKLGAAAASDPEVRARLEAFGGDEFTAAGERVNTYFEETCGIDSGSSGATSSPGG